MPKPMKIRPHKVSAVSSPASDTDEQIGEFSPVMVDMMIVVI